VAGPAGGDPCKDLARELAHIERSGCLRYLRVDYSILDNVCRYRKLFRSSGERVYLAYTSVKRASEECSNIQGVLDTSIDDIYGTIYLEVKRAMDMLEEEWSILRNALGRLRRITIGSSASLLLLDAALLMVAPENLAVLLALVAVAMFSALITALPGVAPRLSTSMPIALALVLLAISAGVRDPVKLSASIAVLAVLILAQLYRGPRHS